MIKLIAAAFTLLFRSRAHLIVENIALRQQLIVLSRQVPRPRPHDTDRLLWILLSSIWSGWRGALLIVRPTTVLRWHKRGWRWYWRWRSGGGAAGRPTLDRKVIALIRRMARENPTWGAPHIQHELRFLGYDVAISTVARYMKRGPHPGGQNWATFLCNHADQIAGFDFFVVPTSRWRAQQLIEAFPFDTAPRFLIHDRDPLFMADEFQRWTKHLGSEDLPTAPRSPWQNGHTERVIGSIRRECTDRLLVWNEAHLRRLLKKYVAYYNDWRPHTALDGDAPNLRAPDLGSSDEIVAIPMVGGLHPRYRRAA